MGFFVLVFVVDIVVFSNDGVGKLLDYVLFSFFFRKDVRLG